MQQIINRVFSCLIALSFLWILESSTTFAYVVKYPVITNELDSIIQYNNNVFRTSRFLTPQDGFAVIPKYHFGIKTKAFGRHKFQFDYRIKVKYYLPSSKKLENLNGYNHSFKLSLLSKSGRKGKAKNNWDYGVGYRSNNYKYINRDTGDVQSQAAPDDRETTYMFTEPSLFAGYKHKGIDKSIIKANFSYAMRDYINPVGPSYDRNITKLGASYLGHFQKNLRWQLQGGYTMNQYTTNTANSATGGGVAGTLQNLNDMSLDFKLMWNKKGYFASPFINYFTRTDTYQDYWSYDQMNIGWKISKKLKNKQKLSGKISIRNRKYDLLTGSNGGVRTCSTINMTVDWNKKLKSGDMHVQVANKSEKDSNNYYSYDQMKITVGFMMKL